MTKFRRRTFLINRPFQIKFSFYVCSWIFGLSLVYPMIIYSLFDFFLGKAAKNPYGPALSEIESTRTQIFYLLVLLQLLFLLITFLVSIFVSHRIAGPLYKLKLFMAKLRDGRTENLTFRTADHFQDLAQSYNEMADGVQATLSRSFSGNQTMLPVLKQALASNDPAQIKRAAESCIQILESQPKG